MSPEHDDERDDERLTRSRRADRSPERASRATSDRPVEENRELTDEYRLELFQQAFFKEALPDLPTIPGYHVCWLTTTNQHDTVAMRTRLGYVPVTPEDVPGWEYATIKDGEHAGMIGVNEMLAYKLPIRLYQAYMAEAHHHAPQREQEKLTAVLDTIAEEAVRHKAQVIEAAGTQELRRNVPPPQPEAWE
jgi:hypothetical protein